jgi:hypothetical protein
MENVVYYFLGLVGISLGAWVSMFYFGEVNSARYERELIDRLRPTRDPWQVVAEWNKPRCEYCNGTLLQITDRCTHCGAPQ